jgi:Arc/MetJ family transcription regulator
VGLHQWTKPTVSRLTITDGDGLYANVVLTFDQSTERSVVETLLRSPKWYVVNNASSRKQT